MIESLSTLGKVLMNRPLILKRNKAPQSFANARTGETKGMGRMKRKYKSEIIKQFHGNHNKTGKTVLFSRSSWTVHLKKRKWRNEREKSERNAGEKYRVSANYYKRRPLVLIMHYSSILPGSFFKFASFSCFS